MRNVVQAFDEAVFANVSIKPESVEQMVQQVRMQSSELSSDEKARRLLQAVTLIDLTSLAGGETRDDIEKLCHKSLNPLDGDLLAKISSCDNLSSFATLTTAAVCVYPVAVPSCRDYFEKVGKRVPIATVTGFPSGSETIKNKLHETELVAKQGAQEIDIVIDKTLALSNNWLQLHSELSQARELCSKLGTHLKVILKVGDLDNLDMIYKASMAAMMAGADFIKTSTGKELVNATLPFGIVMTQAISKYHSLTGIQVGFKPAGGIKTAKDALEWMTLIKNQLGEEWINPSLFRFGASSLLGNIEQELNSLL